MISMARQMSVHCMVVGLKAAPVMRGLWRMSLTPVRSRCALDLRNRLRVSGELLWKIAIFNY